VGVPKSQLDWLGVFGLWLGALIMAIKTGDIPLIHGFPSLFVSPLWGYVPFGLVTLYGVVALMRARAEPVTKPPYQETRRVDPSTTATPPDLQPITDTNGRLFLAGNTDAKFLMALCEGKTNVQAKRAVEPYIGTWLRHKGPIYDVRAYPSGNTDVSIALDAFGIVTLNFDLGSNSSMAELLHKGDVIEIVGEIEDIRRTGINLKNGEITAR